MEDFFHLLGVARRPWLDAAALQIQFDALSNALHPDRMRGANLDQAEAARQFAGLNAAYRCLKEPRERLRHLLELELGHRPVDLQEMPAGLADTFLQVGELTRQAGKFAVEAAQAGSPLLKIGLLKKAQALTEKLEPLRQQVESGRDGVLKRIQDLDGRWSDHAKQKGLVAELQTCWRLLSFYTKWYEQIREAKARLFI